LESEEAQECGERGIGEKARASGGKEWRRIVWWIGEEPWARRVEGGGAEAKGLKSWLCFCLHNVLGGAAR